MKIRSCVLILKLGNKTVVFSNIKYVWCANNWCHKQLPSSHQKSKITHVLLWRRKVPTYTNFKKEPERVSEQRDVTSKNTTVYICEKVTSRKVPLKLLWNICHYLFLNITKQTETVNSDTLQKILCTKALFFMQFKVHFTQKHTYFVLSK